MPYTPYTWADGPEGGTPILAEKLNNIEEGIEAATEAAEGAIPATAEIQDIVRITQAAYDALDPKVATTLYVVVG